MLKIENTEVICDREIENDGRAACRVDDGVIHR